MEYIAARQIVCRTSKAGGFFGYDYNMNLYRGCCHGCIYCDSRSDCYRIDNFETVRAKKEALKIVERELRFKHKTGVVSTGSMSDPYNPYEGELELTRGALELLDRYGFGVSAITKSPLIARDTGLFQRIAHHSVVSPKITITTADDGLCALLEPNVAVTSERFGAIRAMSDAGLFTGIAVMPLLPWVNDTDENMRGLVEMVAASGAKYVYVQYGLTLRQSQRDYFFSQLDRLFPGLKKEYIRTFGDQYHCVSPRSDALRRVLATECKKHGLLYRLRDILAAQNGPYEQPQMSLFPV